MAWLSNGRKKTLGCAEWKKNNDVRHFLKNGFSHFFHNFYSINCFWNHSSVKLGDIHQKMQKFVKNFLVYVKFHHFFVFWIVAVRQLGRCSSFQFWVDYKILFEEQRQQFCRAENFPSNESKTNTSICWKSP